MAMTISCSSAKWVNQEDGSSYQLWRQALVEAQEAVPLLDVADVLEHGGQGERRLAEKRLRVSRSDRFVANLDQNFGILERVGQGGEAGLEGELVPVDLFELGVIIGRGPGC